MKIDQKLKKDLKKFLSEKILQDKNRINVECAYPISQEEKEMVKKNFKSLDWDNSIFTVDESIIAGIKIKTGSRVYDLSLSGILDKLAKNLYETNR